VGLAKGALSLSRRRASAASHGARAALADLKISVTLAEGMQRWAAEALAAETEPLDAILAGAQCFVAETAAAVIRCALQLRGAEDHHLERLYRDTAPLIQGTAGPSELKKTVVAAMLGGARR
jgi:alkylation response protein AidB-like acyl-CoA dehydrogenase